MPTKLTQEEFERRVKTHHLDKYDLDNVNYVGSAYKVKIMCKIHGEFVIKAGHLMTGSGCSKCANTYVRTTTEFIEEACKIHGHKYSYENVKYIGSKTKVNVTCPTHGSFMITPGNLLRGYGCSKCAGMCRLTVKQFTERCAEVYEDGLYSYNHGYTSMDSNIVVSCNVHNITFELKAKHHLNGSACPLCKANDVLPYTLYYLKVESDQGTFFKIGTSNLLKRLIATLTKKTVKITLVYSIKLKSRKQAKLLEKMVIKKFEEYIYKGATKVLGKHNGNTKVFTRDVFNSKQNAFKSVRSIVLSCNT